MNSFQMGDRIVVRGILDLAGLHGQVISYPRGNGAAWIRLDGKPPIGGVPFRKAANGSTIVSLFPTECDAEEKPDA